MHTAHLIDFSYNFLKQTLQSTLKEMIEVINPWVIITVHILDQSEDGIESDISH